MTRYFAYLVLLSLALPAAGKVIPRADRLQPSRNDAWDSALGRGSRLEEPNEGQTASDLKDGEQGMVNMLGGGDENEGDGSGPDGDGDEDELDGNDPNSDSLVSSDVTRDELTGVNIPSSDKNTLDNIIEINDHNAGAKRLLFEGDIRREPGSSRKRDVILSAARKWPKSGNFVLLPYTITGLSSEFVRAIQGAIDNIQRISCVRIIPRTVEKDYVNFFDGGGCWSSIGRVGNKQDLSLGPGCQFGRVATHELFHSLGFWHEQSRLDRDDFITIYWDNVAPNRAFNFRKYAVGAADYYGGAYDPLSIMHYGNYAFSTNKQKTIEWKADPAFKLAGDRLTSTDIHQLNALYDCNRNCDAFGRTNETVVNTTTLQAQLDDGLRLLRGNEPSDVALRVFNFVTLCQYTNYYASVVVSAAPRANSTSVHDFSGSGLITSLIGAQGRSTVVYTKLRTEETIGASEQQTLLDNVIAANKNQNCDARANRERASDIVAGKAFFVLVVRETTAAAQQSTPNSKSGSYPCRSCVKGICTNLVENVYLGF